MHDPAVTRAAIEELRKELRGRTGGKLAGPPAEGAPAEAVQEPPGEVSGDVGVGGGDISHAMLCPNCGHKMVPDEGAADQAPDEGSKKDLLLIMPEKKSAPEKK